MPSETPTLPCSDGSRRELRDGDEVELRNGNTDTVLDNRSTSAIADGKVWEQFAWVSPGGGCWNLDGTCTDGEERHGIVRIITPIKHDDGAETRVMCVQVRGLPGHLDRLERVRLHLPSRYGPPTEESGPATFTLRDPEPPAHVQRLAEQIAAGVANGGVEIPSLVKSLCNYESSYCVGCSEHPEGSYGKQSDWYWAFGPEPKYLPRDKWIDLAPVRELAERIKQEQDA